MQGHEDICKLLLENKASVNVTNKQGLTPLHYAALHGHSSICKILRNYGADISAKSRQGLTPVALTLSFEVIDILNLRVRNQFEK